jgi:hypothetical protein
MNYSRKQLVDMTIFELERLIGTPPRPDVSGQQIRLREEVLAEKRLAWAHEVTRKDRRLQWAILIVAIATLATTLIFGFWG